jgi:transcriptional regulator with XRE-family HTH domain
MLTIADRRQKLQDLIRTLRLEAGLTQADLATRLGRPQSYVSKYESGERRLDFVELHDVCIALNLGIDEFAEKYMSETNAPI